ncbi:MAG: hypothetical protein CMH27_08260 [Micavibrio sp.]|nr:hypothetical protein [Micavibrio sp.]
MPILCKSTENSVAQTINPLYKHRVMSIRFFTDSHHAPSRPSPKSSRHCERSLPLIQQCLNTITIDCEAVIFGGDAIMATYNQPQIYHETLMQEFGAAACQSRVPFHPVAGNHEYDYFRDLDRLSALTGLSYANKVIDLNDGQRLIFLNDQFHDHGLRILYPYTDESLDFVRTSMAEAPTNMITLITHTPIDDFGPHLAKTIRRKDDPAYSFRSNAGALRKLLENSGKNCLVLSGHTHHEHFFHHRNVAYLTLQSLIEGVRAAWPEKTHARWADITRKDENSLHIKLHGHNGRDIHHTYFPSYTKAPSSALATNDTAAADMPPSLAAE